MQLIVITPESLLFKEASAINKLFEHGLQRLHIRKPSASVYETENLIKSIDTIYHRQVVIHDHFQLLEIFGLKGIHINRRNPDIFIKTGITVSRSCHSISELEVAGKYDYLFLSPVYDSISKTGYRKAFTSLQLKEAHAKGIINRRTIALGGVTSDRITEIKRYGFGGIAVLGTLWGNYDKDGMTDELIRRFKNLNETCMKL